MTRPLIYFDGTNVMLIRESDVPTAPIGLKTDSREYGAWERNYLEAAKKKAIRVENAVWHEIDSNAWRVRIDNSKLIEINGGYTTPSSLPSGYTYEVQQSIKCSTIGCAETDFTPGVFNCRMTICNRSFTEVAIIKPVLPEEGEDELWRQVLSILFDSELLPNIYKHEVEELKSKYKLTRR